MLAAVRALRRSLRGRLLAGTLAWILVSVAVAGWGLGDLFRQHITRQFEEALTIHLNQLLASFNVDAAGTAVVSPLLSDPRLGQPLSGLYWQVDRLEPDAEVAGIVRSRSLWDQTLTVPESGVVTGQIRHEEIIGPEGAPLLALVRTIRPPDSDADFRLIIAGDQRVLAEPMHQFQDMLMISLGILAAGLTLAAVVQVLVGLRPLARLRRRLADVHEGRAVRIDGRFPSEVQPLVDDFNRVLTANEEIIERARTQAGNLAHAVKTPLTVIANAAEREMTPFGQLVSEQSAMARRQISHHLARARAAAAVQASGRLRTPLKEPVQALARVLRTLYVERGLEIELPEMDDTLAFRGEEQDLHEILGNLLENACKWAATRVRVRVGVVQEGRQLLISIEDDGPGLTLEVSELVFQRGVRMDEQKTGSGLGLAIVKDLTEAYGGTVQAGRSALGGLSVVVRLPAAPLISNTLSGRV